MRRSFGVARGDVRLYECSPGAGMASELEKLKTDLEAAIAAAPDSRALEEVRVAALGRNGSVTAPRSPINSNVSPSLPKHRNIPSAP